jgi:hypothetical protein
VRVFRDTKALSLDEANQVVRETRGQGYRQNRGEQDQ